MKKLKYMIPALFAAVFAALVLVSCGGYNFYKDWSEAGATIEKDNCFEAISLDDTKEKIDNDKTFVLMIGMSSCKNAVTSVTSMYNLTEYLNFEGTIYFLDGTDYYKKLEDRKKVNSTIGVNDFSKVTSDLIFVLYSKGEIVYDTSKNVTSSDDNLKDFTSLMTYICTDFNFEA